MSLISELRRRNVFRVAIAYSVTAWLVAQVAELALESFGAPDWVIKTILFLLVAGLPFALIFAWAYELTPEGIKREAEVERKHSITRQTGRKLNYAIIGVLSIALILAIATRNWPGPGTAPGATSEPAVGEKSIAVLPFVNMSDDPNNEYFSDGISEELLNVLVRIEGLRVASRTSSFSFKGKDTAIPDIAAALNVDHVLEGSVRKAGNTVRVTAQLIDVKTDSHLWSATYDRKLEDIFVIQDEISAHIVEALKVALSTGEIVQTPEQPTANLAAYEDYLRGRHFWQRRGADNIRRAIELFTRATEEDPGFARAWSSLGAAHLTLPVYSDEPKEVHMPRALEYSQRALELDPLLSEPHAVIADLLRLDLRWGEAEEHYLRAIELEPKNSTGYLWYAEQLVATGRREAALQRARQAIDLDPYHPGTNSLISYAYALTGDMDGARKHLGIARDLGHPGSLFALMDLLLELGEMDAARPIVEQARATLPAGATGVFDLYVRTFSEPELADAFLSSDFDAVGVSNFWIALQHIRLGRIDEGLQLALEAQPDGSEWLEVWLPLAAPMRQHPRFGELVRAAGLDDFWDEVGLPPQCAENGDNITCD